MEVKKKKIYGRKIVCYLILSFFVCLVKIYFEKLYKMLDIYFRCSEWFFCVFVIQFKESIMVFGNFLIIVCIF